MTTATFTTGTHVADVYAPDFHRQVTSGDRVFDLTATTLDNGRRYALEITATDEDGAQVSHLTAVVAATALAQTRWMFGRIVDEVRAARKRMGVIDEPPRGW